MTFISYAQNYEDVMLWRALKHVERGFYIDVGAWSPDQDSVTRAFYEKGWHGINVEPNPEFNAQLCARRPRDINLKLAVGDREAVLTMNFLGNPGLSTLDDGIAQKHQAAGWTANRQEVEVTTLAAIWQAHVPAGQEVHFLKVDVEGSEEAVLKGNDWQKYRPWVVVVEATLPMSQVESHDKWEHILLDAGYQYAYADGLNRFYVAQEHPELLSAFKYPPNVFDEFTLVGQVQAEVRATAAEQRTAEAENRAIQAEARATAAEQHAAAAEARATAAEQRTAEAENRAIQAEARVNDLLNSTSWRITAPLRWLAGLAHRFTPQALKPKLKLFLQHTALYVRRRPWLRRVTLGVLAHFPSLKTRLLRIVTDNGASHSSRQSDAPTELAHLTPRARRIYTDLKSALARQQKEGN